MRHTFGGGTSDWAFTWDSDGSVAQAAGVALTFWDSLVAGNQYLAAPMPGGIDDGTGLLDGTGMPISTVTCDSNGEIPDALQGPDGVYRMAADASGAGTGPRRWLTANDMGDDLTTLFGDVAGIPALQAAPIYVYYNTTLAAYPERPSTTAPVWWVGPVAPPVGGTGALAAYGDVWLNTTGTIAPGGVNSVTAGDASVSIGGTAGAPTVETGTLDEIATLHAPAADWSNNGHKITNTAAGVASTDVATVGQLTGLTPTAVKTSAYTAAASDFVLVSTASGAVTITLPAAPADRTRIGVKMTAQSAANAVTVTRGGSDVFNVTGGGTSLTLLRLFQTVTLQYEASAAVWLVTGTDPALAIDTTAGDIAAVGTTAAAGATGKAADAGHVHVQSYIGMFGDGSDGAVTFNGTTTYTGFATTTGTAPNLSYTLTRDVFATSITISSGITVAPGSFRMLCKGAFTSNGTVAAAGNNAAGSVAGASTGNGTVGGGRAGGAGNTGAGSTGNSGSIGTGGGGAGGAGTPGAAGAGGSPVLASPYVFRAGPYAALTGCVQYSNTNVSIGGGCGGGGGGGDGTNKGGGGGSGGGLIIICAWTITNSGTISAAGGNGAAATTGNCGGGGGGGGGLVLGYSLSAWTAGTLTVAGGTAGAGVGTGVAGTAGTAGASLNVVVS